MNTLAARKPATQAVPRKPGRKTEISEAQKYEIKEAFDLFDSNATGRIDVKELKMAMRALGFDATKEEIRKIAGEVDKDQSGYIEYQDFLDIMGAKVCSRDPREEMLKAFRLFDDDGSGKISFKNLKRVAKDLGENISDEELKEMIEEADKKGEGEGEGEGGEGNGGK
eukprot:GHVU01034171.1.p1 GENE.GHVU01034171.1~~GHVU01034171.1.p1  ORF type:complete len:168 (-),score=43.40 GHVU01034171.1:971-1474(-)